MRPVYREKEVSKVRVEDRKMSLSEEPTTSQSNEFISVDGEYIESIQKKNVERHETAVQEGISSSKSSISESNQQRSPARVNWLSPPRSKVSDRIKAFSSPSWGANVWKNSPSRLSTVPGRWGSGNSNVSNGSSEKDSSNNYDDDSLSVTTP